MSRKPGRPTKLDADTKASLLDSISLGMKWGDACIIAGICYKTFCVWIERGEKEETGEYFHFVQELKKAKFEGKKARIKRIEENESWQSDAWLLERLSQTEFGLRNDREDEQERDLSEFADILQNRYNGDG